MASDTEHAESLEADTTFTADQSSGQLYRQNVDVTPEQVAQIGSRLQEAREANKLTIEQVAERLRFTPQRVRDLESNDFTRMGVKAYARGYLQSYAKLLHIDDHEMIAVFDTIEFPAAQNKRSLQLVLKREISGPSIQIKWFGIGIALFIVALMGFWWHSAREHNKEDSVTSVLAPVSDSSNSSDSAANVNTASASNLNASTADTSTSANVSSAGSVRDNGNAGTNTNTGTSSSAGSVNSSFNTNGNSGYNSDTQVRSSSENFNENT